MTFNENTHIPSAIPRLLYEWGHALYVLRAQGSCYSLTADQRLHCAVKVTWSRDPVTPLLYIRYRNGMYSNVDNIEANYVQLSASAMVMCTRYWDTCHGRRRQASYPHWAVSSIMCLNRLNIMKGSQSVHIMLWLVPYKPSMVMSICCDYCVAQPQRPEEGLAC